MFYSVSVFKCSGIAFFIIMSLRPPTTSSIRIITIINKHCYILSSRSRSPFCSISYIRHGNQRTSQHKSCRQGAPCGFTGRRRAAPLAVPMGQFGYDDVLMLYFTPYNFINPVHTMSLLSIELRFTFTCNVFLFRCRENHFSRQAWLQKIVRLSFGSVISTKVPQLRHWKALRMTTELTFLECFQYSRSQWAEQNLMRRSVGSVTRTSLPHFRQRKVRRASFFRDERT